MMINIKSDRNQQFVESIFLNEPVAYSYYQKYLDKLTKVCKELDKIDNFLK